MNTPKVIFSDIKLSTEVDWIYNFLFDDDWGWGKSIVKKHPKIKAVFLLKTKDKRIDFLKKYIFDFKKDNKEKIEVQKNIYQMAWQKIEKDYFKIISEIMQIDWPKDRKKIKAMISINPICPRFLDDWSFSIFYNYKKISHAMETIMHESCHFLYFEKWKKEFPEADKKKFESSYIEWHLSEIIAPIILNDSRVQKLLKQKAFFYEEHEKMKINNVSVPKYFSELYEKNKKSKNDFVVFLINAYKEIKINETLFI